MQLSQIGKTLAIVFFGVSSQLSAQPPSAKQAGDSGHFRKLLDADPKNAAAFRGLLGALTPGESRADLGDRFAKLDDPKQWLEVFAQECRKTNDADALERLAAAMKRLDPQAPRVDQYLMRAKFWAGKTDDATNFLREALKLAKDAHAKKAVREEYLRGMARAGKPVAAYRAFPGGVESFRILAEQLVASGEIKGLRDLISEHEAFFDDDVNLLLYRGQLAFEEREWARADAAWTTAFKQYQDESIKELFRRRWVRARFGADKSIEALRDIAPANETLRLLAELCLAHGQKETLAALLSYELKAGFGREQALEMLLQMHPDADFGSLVKLAARMGLSDESAEALVVRYWSKNGKGVNVYQAAGEKRKAFEKIAEVLLDYRDLSDLHRVIELHREAEPMDPEIDFIEAQMFLRLVQPVKALESLAKIRGIDLPAFSVREFRYKKVHFEASYLAGKGIKVYEDELNIKRSGFDSSFNMLALYYTQDHDAAGLEALLKARPPRQTDLRLWEYQALVKLLSGKPDEALALHAAKRKEVMSPDPNPPKKGFGGFGKKTEGKTDFRQSSFKSAESDLMRTMIEVGRGLEFYRAAAFPESAFASLAGHYVNKRDRTGLENLIKEHRSKHPNDPKLAAQTANLELLRGNLETAEDFFRGELAQPLPMDKSEKFAGSLRNLSGRTGLSQSLVRQGRTVEHYRFLGGDSDTFQRLANLCVREEATTELAMLLSAHRKYHPKDRNLTHFEGELCFLRGQYDAAFEILKGFTGRYDSQRDKVIACLVRLKRFNEAVRLAKDWEQNIIVVDPTPLVLAHAAAGDVKETTRLMEIHAKRFHNREQFYRNADLGPLLRSDAFRQLRERFPDPIKP